MAQTRLFIKEKLSSGLELELGSEQARYIGRVLRLRSGDSLNVFSSASGEFSASVLTVTKSAVVLLLDAPVETFTESPLKVHLVQGISRGERMDFVVQKATELGVKRISPVLTEYGMVKLDSKRAAKRRDHWQGVAESACEQSGRIQPPLIDPPLSLNAWFGTDAKETDTDLILRPGASTVLTAITAPVTKICVLVGPSCFALAGLLPMVVVVNHSFGRRPAPLACQIRPVFDESGSSQLARRPTQRQLVSPSY